MPEERAPEGPPPEDGLPVPQRYWSAITVWLAIGMAVLDSALANVALPTISREFQVDPADAIWIVNAYQIAIVVTLLPLASLGEIVGYRRVYLAGLLVFTLASLACSLATTLPELVAARMAQGLGAGGIMAINAALVRYTYPAKVLGRAIGWNALVVSVTSALGPSVAAAILSVGPWQWLFAINVPLGIATLAVAWFALPRTPAVPRPFDTPGATLNALAFGLIIVSVDFITRTPRKLLGAVMMAAGIACGTLLALRGRRQPLPLLPVDLLRIPVFALSVATSICSFCAQMLAFVSMPFFLETQMGMSPVDVGLLLTPWPIAVGLVVPLAGTLSDRFSAAILCGAGLLLFAAGLAALALVPRDASHLDIAWRMAICGLGFGFFQAPNNRTLISSAPRARSGAAGGMLATARLTGQTAGATLVAVLFALDPIRAEPRALTIASALAILGAVASFARIRRMPPP